jgi:NAD(P)H-hydrate epimerase
MKALSATEMREVDRLTTERHGISSVQLMENAGTEVAEFVLREISRCFQTPVREVVVLCGKGNNGGDGLVAARHLREQIRHTAVLLLSSPEDLRGDTKTNLLRWRDAGGETVVVESEAAWEAAQARVAGADVVLDALFGTGMRGAASGVPAHAIAWLNELSRNATSARPGLIIAVDMPSGLPADGEGTTGPVVAAHSTVTFTAPKVGQLISPNASRCGSLVVRQIGTPATLVEELGKGRIRWAGPDEFSSLPLVRPANSHKGLYGHVLVVAGSVGKSGAASLAGLGALKSGAGLVTVATAAPLQPVVAGDQQEYMTEPLPTLPDGSIDADRLDMHAASTLLAGKTVLAVGPGLGQAPGIRQFVHDLVRTTSLPTILDADGLNAFAGVGDELTNRKSPFLAITPHPGEMARLLGITNAEVQKDRVQVAMASARQWKAHVLLKGFHTVLASPAGEVFVNTTGNPGLAKGGSGDVLTGILAALTGQFGTDDWLRVLALGAFLHGKAADTLAEDGDPSGIVASEVARALPFARRELLEEIRFGG